MDINSLRVFNALQNLGISDTEFADLENEQKHTERTGVYIRCVKKGHAICVSHDERHKIVIKQIQNKKKINLSSVSDFPTPSRILLKTLITFDDLPQDIYKLHAIAQYRALDTDIRHRATSLEELKDMVVHRFIDKKPTRLGDFYEETYYSELHSYDESKRTKYQQMKIELVDEQLKSLFWLFGDDYSKFQQEVKFARNNIPRIIKVFERNNMRLAIIQRNDNYEKRRGGMMYSPVWLEQIEGINLMIIGFKPSDKRYNYVDMNRELYLPQEYNEHYEIWLDDDLFEKLGFHELKVLSKRLGQTANPNLQINDDDEDSDGDVIMGGNWILMNADEYNKKETLIRLEVMSAKRKEQEKVAKKDLIESIEAQFQNGKVTRQGITFTKKSIECEGVIVRNPKLGEYIISQQIHLLQEPNFQKIVRDFVCWILHIEATTNYNDNYKVSYSCEFNGKETIQIGKVKLSIESNKNNIFVNNHRICKNDLVDIIFNAMQFTAQKEFDEYLEYSGKVNLQLQKILQVGGVSFELKLDDTDDNSLSTKYENTKCFKMTLPVKRDKGKNYVIIKGKDYKIKNISALLDLQKNVDSCRVGYGGGGYLQRTIKLFYKAITDITPKDIGDLIKNGEKEWNKLEKEINKDNAEKSKKADEFVANAVRISKAKPIKDGYIVRGISGKTYTINAESLAVYEVFPKEHNKKRYVCIVDLKTPTDTEYGRKDALAKRLLMLAQDLKVADEVHTLNFDGIEIDETELREYNEFNNPEVMAE
jgi:hypothetical protein